MHSRPTNTPRGDSHIFEVGEWGLREAVWEDLELVQHWRRFMQRPQSYLRHLLDDAE